MLIYLLGTLVNKEPQSLCSSVSFSFTLLPSLFFLSSPICRLLYCLHFVSFQYCYLYYHYDFYSVCHSQRTKHFSLKTYRNAFVE